MSFANVNSCPSKASLALILPRHANIVSVPFPIKLVAVIVPPLELIFPEASIVAVVIPFV